MWHRGILLWMMLVLLLIGRGVNAADLAEAKQRLAEWEQKIVSIRIRSQSRSKPETNTLTAEAGLEFSGSDSDWAWEKTGRFRDQHTTRSSSDTGSRSLQMADHKHYYFFSLSDTDKSRESPTRVRISANNIGDPMQSHTYHRPFHGLWDDATRTWLGERIQNVTEATVTNEGLLEFDGTFIGLGNKGPIVDKKKYIVRLDPKHGYLPKSIEREGTFLYQVDEFQEVEPGFWFPKTGSFLSTMPDYHLLGRWEVKEVELNLDSPDFLFVPPLAGDTRVDNTITGKRYWYGEKRSANLPPPVDPRNQNRPSPLTTTLGGVICLVLIGIASIAFIIRKRHTN